MNENWNILTVNRPTSQQRIDLAKPRIGRTVNLDLDQGSGSIIDKTSVGVSRR